MPFLLFWARSKRNGVRRVKFPFRLSLFLITFIKLIQKRARKAFGFLALYSFAGSVTPAVCDRFPVARGGRFAVQAANAEHSSAAFVAVVADGGTASPVSAVGAVVLPAA